MSEIRDPARRLWLRASLVYAAAFGYLHLLQFQTPYIPGYDGYYHIKYAQLLPSLGFVSEFKWAAYSIWATRFADKELLYHLLLVPFARFEDPATGLKYATVLLGAAAVVSFYLVLALNRLRFPLAWTLALCAAGPHFLHRLGAPRPHVLSLILLLWSVHLILNHKRVALAAVIFVYSLSYTAFHLPLGLALIVAAQRLLVERKLDWKTPAVILAASLLGVLVHPHFPNNLQLFWLQNFVVPWTAVNRGLELNLAEEFYPLATRDFLWMHLSVWLPYLGALCLVLARPRKPTPKTLSLFLVSTTLLLMSLTMRRFIEYSMPLTLFFLASFYTDRLAGFDLRAALETAGRRRRRIVATLAVIAVGIVLLLAMTYREALPLFRPVPPMREAAALYLQERTDPDEIVFTCDWDDAPELFYFNHHNRYPVLLDPNFMCYQDPERCREWARVAAGGFAGRSYDILARDYRYGVCTWDYRKLKRIVEKDSRMEIVLDSGGAWVFRIDREQPEIGLDQFLELAPER